MNFWIRLTYVFVGPVALTGAALVHGRPQAFLFAVGCLATLLGFILAERNLSHAARQQILDTAVDFMHASGISDVRANFMRLRRRGMLKMQYPATAYRDFESMNNWRRGDGSCASTALEERVTVLGGHAAELVGKRDVDFRVRIMSMKKLEQEEIKSVLSVPVFRRDGSSVAGVINFDDVVPLNESKLADSNILRAAKHLGETFLRSG